MPDPTIPAAAPVEPAKATGSEAKTETVAASTASAAAAALDKAMDAMLSNETKTVSAEPAKEPAGKETKTEDQPSGKSAEAEVKTDTVTDDEPRVEFGEPKAAAKTDDVEEEHQGGFPKDWPEAAVKNLLKEREKRKEARVKAEAESKRATDLEARVKEIESENSKLKQVPKSKASPSASPVDAIESESDLSDFRKSQMEVIDACDIYADGKPRLDEAGNPVLDEEGNPVIELNKRQIAEIRIRARRALEEDVPKRAQFLKQRGEYEADTVNRYPWLKNESSKAAQEVHRIRDQWQNIAHGPGVTRMIVWALRGRDLEYKENEARKAAPEKKATAQPTKSSAERPSPSKGGAKDARKSAASASIANGKGGEKALEEFLAADLSED